MFKTIIKEIVIVILLLFATALVLGIVFYDYIQTDITVPSKKEAYELPIEVSEELATTLNDNSQEIVKTYQLDATDLDRYERNDEYDSGKVNPFGDYTVEPNNTAIEGQENTNTVENTSGTFLNIVGK